MPVPSWKIPLLITCVAIQPLCCLASEPILEASTLHSLGVHWIVEGSSGAPITLEWKKQQEPSWHRGQPLLQVESGAHFDANHHSSIEVPEGSIVFAGSAVLLEPDTAYELRLTLSGSGSSAAPVILKARTAAEPAAAAGAPVKHVVPGQGGGNGSLSAPFLGLASAQAEAKAGDLFLLHQGTYTGTFKISKNGESGKPIIWRGAGDGEAIIDAQGDAPKRPSHGIMANDAHDVWFERLTVRNADWGILGHDAARIVIRGCHIHQVEYGIAATRNDHDAVRGWFIADNLIEGPTVWPRSKGIEDARGIQLTGEGHDVCYNRISNFADAIDTFPSPRCADIDFHHNDISQMTDDGIEMDYSERNTRCFLNRLTNVFQGISVQPVYGGPTYIFRNTLYNVVSEPFKMHNSPSGVLFYHNTCVKRGLALQVGTDAKVRHCATRNNLFIGTSANYAFEMDAPVDACDFDYDGFSSGPWKYFLKWENTRYRTIEEVRTQAPVEQHATSIGAASAFSDGTLPPADEKLVAAAPDLRPKDGGPAIDTGLPLAGFNDDFAGKAPDLGACEAGAALPSYGPRPNPKP